MAVMDLPCSSQQAVLNPLLSSSGSTAFAGAPASYRRMKQDQELDNDPSYINSGSASRLTALSEESSVSSTGGGWVVMSASAVEGKPPAVVGEGQRKHKEDDDDASSPVLLSPHAAVVAEVLREVAVAATICAPIIMPSSMSSSSSDIGGPRHALELHASFSVSGGGGVRRGSPTVRFAPEVVVVVDEGDSCRGRLANVRMKIDDDSVTVADSHGGGDVSEATEEGGDDGDDEEDGGEYDCPLLTLMSVAPSSRSNNHHAGHFRVVHNTSPLLQHVSEHNCYNDTDTPLLEDTALSSTTSVLGGRCSRSEYAALRRHSSSSAGGMGAVLDASNVIAAPNGGLGDDGNSTAATIVVPLMTSQRHRDALARPLRSAMCY